MDNLFLFSILFLIPSVISLTPVHVLLKNVKCVWAHTFSCGFYPGEVVLNLLEYFVIYIFNFLIFLMHHVH